MARPIIPAEISRAIREKREIYYTLIISKHIFSKFALLWCKQTLLLPCVSVCWNTMALLVVLGEVVLGEVVLLAES